MAVMAFVGIMATSRQIDIVFIDQQLKAEARVTEVRSRKEALLQGDLYNHDKVLCASAQGSFALLKPEVAEKLGIAAAEEIKALLEK